MQMYTLFAILLIHLELISAALLNNCYPDRLEGRQFRVETESTTFFAIDFVNQRYYQTEDPTSDVFKIIDFGVGYAFSIDGENCEAVAFPNVEFFNQCITNDFNLPALTLGELNSGVDVAAVGYRVHGVDRKVLATRANQWILPFFMQDVYDDNTTCTSVFYDVTESISLLGKLIGSDTAKCESETWASWG